MKRCGGSTRPAVRCPDAHESVLGRGGRKPAQKGPRSAGRLGAAIGLAVCFAGLSGCTGVLGPQGPVGAAQRTILLNSLSIMLCIIVPVIVGTCAFAWWFRAANSRARYRPDWAYSGRLELVTWSIPIMVILFLGGIAWIGSHDLDPAAPLPSATEAMEVDVVALDWKWLFIYPKEGVASVNRLVVPAGVPVRFRITSASVMNAFFIPQLGSMIYAMNGMTTQLNLQADKPGIYRGLSTHFSGDGFADMHFAVEAVPADQFASWAARTLSEKPVLNQAAYGALARQSINVAPFLYGAVQPGLFEAVATQKIAPSPGPDTGSPSPDVSPRTEN